MQCNARAHITYHGRYLAGALLTQAKSILVPRRRRRSSPQWCKITPNAKLRDSSIYLDSYQKHEKLNRGRSWQEAGRRLHRHLVESSVHAHPDPILRPKSTEAAAAVASAASFWADSFLQLNVSHLGSLPPTYKGGCWPLDIVRSRWWASLIADLPFEMHFCK